MPIAAPIIRNIWETLFGDSNDNRFKMFNDALPARFMSLTEATAWIILAAVILGSDDT